MLWVKWSKEKILTDHTLQIRKIKKSRSWECRQCIEIVKNLGTDGELNEILGSPASPNTSVAPSLIVSYFANRHAAAWLVLKGCWGDSTTEMLRELHWFMRNSPRALRSAGLSVLEFPLRLLEKEPLNILHLIRGTFCLSTLENLRTYLFSRRQQKFIFLNKHLLSWYFLL